MAADGDSSMTIKCEINFIGTFSQFHIQMFRSLLFCCVNSRGESCICWYFFMSKGDSGSIGVDKQVMLGGVCVHFELKWVKKLRT